MAWTPRISTKISLLAIILIGFTALTMDRIYLSGSRDIMVDQQLKELDGEASLLLTRLHGKIQELKNDVRLAYGSEVLQPALKNPSDRLALDRLAEGIRAMLDAKPQYSQISLIGTADNGRELVRINRNGDQIRRSPDSELQSKGGLDYFREALAVQPGQVYLSLIEPNQENGMIVRPVQHVLRAAMPLYRGDRVFGIVIINMNMSALLAEYKELLTGSRELYIANSRGQYLWHPRQDYIFGTTDTERNIYQDYPEAEVAKNEQDRTVYVEIGDGRVLAYSVVPFDELKAFRFLGVGIVAEQAELFGRINAVRKQSILLGLGLVILGMLAAMWFGRLIAGPLNQVTAGVSRFAEKGEIVPLPTEQRDEVGMLAANFSKLLHQIKRHEWLRNGQLQMTQALRGELTDTDVARVVLQQLATDLRAALGAFYRIRENGDLVLLDAYAVRGKAQARSTIPAGDTTLATAVRQRSLQRTSELPNDYFRMQSALGETLPDARVILPVQFQGHVIAVIELARLGAFTDTECELLQQIEETIGLALAVAESRIELRALLEESQQQREELRVSNEELEEQTKRLEESQDELKTQQAELEAVNASMEEKGRALEEHNRHIQQQTGEIELQKQKLEEKAAQLEQASRYKSEFLANMSHELRTPLNSLLILSRSLRDNEEGNLSSEQVEDADMIYNGGIELLELINDILDLSKVEAGKATVIRESVPLQQVAQKLERQFQLLATEKGLKLSVELSDGLPEDINTDSQKLQQVLKNLLSNAVKFTPQGSVTLRISAHADHIEFAVTDTGIGIDPSRQTDVFEAFQQEDGSIGRQYGGTGLGLTIARKLANLLGGDIALQSKKGQGSTFSLRLPLTSMNEMDVAPPMSPRPMRIAAPDRDAQVVALPPSVSKEQAQSRSLLIIEDDATFATVLARLARQNGYHPLIAATGKQGLLIAHSESPAAVVLDLMLPDIDGLQVLEQLKDNIQTRHIPVHVISAREEGQYLPLQKGAVGYLTKPVEPEDINRMFAEVANIYQTSIKRVLVVEDDLSNQKAIKKLLGRKGLEIIAVSDGGTALKKLSDSRFDCVILDLQLPDMTGFEWLEAAGAVKAGEIPPVVVYTARKLTREEIRRLEAYTGSIIIKGAHSPERLLDEVTLFLHSIESSLNAEQRRIIRMQHDPNKVLNGRKIMIVDDDIRNVFALSKQLKKSGMDIIVADNGELALKKLGEHPDVELIIMDIMMPVMDGYEATRRIRKLSAFQDIPIVALTARTMPEEQQKCMDAGANDYLSKPVSVDVLLTLMRVLLFKEVEAA